MQVWNVLQVARWKYRTQKWCTIPQLCRAISSQLRHVSTIEKKRVKQQYLLHMSAQYGELRPTRGWDRFGSLGHPSYFQRIPRLGSVTARQSSSERQPNFAALNKGRHLRSAGLPSRWALAHISSFTKFCTARHDPPTGIKLYWVAGIEIGSGYPLLALLVTVYTILNVEDVTQSNVRARQFHFPAVTVCEFYSQGTQSQ